MIDVRCPAIGLTALLLTTIPVNGQVRMTSIEKAILAFYALPASERRPILHEQIIKYPHSHDSYIDLIAIGDASSVPYLIRALAWEGRSEPAPGRVWGMVCTRAHVLEALSTITNQDAGPNTEDWWRWYDAHRDRTQEQWVLQGFRSIGLTLATPLDDRESRALLQVLGEAIPHVQRHHQTNAQRLLADSPESLLSTVLRKVLLEEDQVTRLGAARYLASRKDGDSASQLCGLLADGNPGVASIARDYFSYWASPAARAACPGAIQP